MEWKTLMGPSGVKTNAGIKPLLQGSPSDLPLHGQPQPSPWEGVFHTRPT